MRHSTFVVGRAVAFACVLGLASGCAPIQIQSNPDAFEVPLEAPPKLRGEQTVDLVNAYKVETEAKLFLGGPGWVGDLRQYTRTAITLLARELRKVGIQTGPSPKTIVLKVHSAQAAPGAFLIPASLTLDAEYGDGTKSSIQESDNASSAWRAVDGALVRAVARLLADERFQAYVNQAGPTAIPSPTPPPAARTEAGVAVTAAAVPATALPAVGTVWQYEHVGRLFARRKTAVTIRVLRTSADFVEESITLGTQGGTAATRIAPAREMRITDQALGADSAMVELLTYPLVSTGGTPPADVVSVNGYPAGGTGFTPWKTTFYADEWEQIQVPAGTFRALRLRINGQREIIGNQIGAIGRFSLVVWYAPDAKRFVRLEHKAWSGAYSTRDQLVNDDVVELTAFRPSS